MSYLTSVVLKHDLEVAEDGPAAKEALARNPSIQAVIVHLPGQKDEVLDLIQGIKSEEPSPIVMVLCSKEEELCVQAFLAGASDVIVWPCSLRELTVRLFVRLEFPLNNELLQPDDESWDERAYIAEKAGLTISEAQVMHVLYARDGETVSRDELSLAVDARPWRYGDRKFDVHVAKLRKKLFDSFGDKMSVSTIRSTGYRLVTNGANIFDTA